MYPMIKINQKIPALITVSHQCRILSSPIQSRKFHGKGFQTSFQNSHSTLKWGRVITVLGAGSLTLLAWSCRKHVAQAFNFGKTNEAKDSQNGQKIISRKEVSQHDSLEKGVWITFRGNVYDITDFIRHHPGGSHTIMMAAGGDVEPFWQTYTVHYAREVQDLLSRYRIGILDPDETKKEQENKAQHDEIAGDPYASDPRRSPLLQVLSKKPFNAETPPRLLTSTYLTPVDVFFVRNHLPVPEIDPNEYKLSICLGSDGDDDNLKVLAEFSLQDLKTKFKRHTIDSVIQCSGNRRSDLKQFKEIKGLNWTVGAMGNARWTGARLVDVLESLNIRQDHTETHDIKHVQLEGLDCDMSGQSYGASISADVAFDQKRNVLLAYEMNGEPLTRDHGFPVRLVAPGVTGARNVKWLGKIILSHEESHSHWQRKDYKSFSPNVDMFSVNFDEAPSVQETPVQSAICDPQDGDAVTVSSQDLSFPVRGYAFSGGGKMIVRVDVSIDGGENWMTADLVDIQRLENGLPDYSARNHSYSWTRWTIDVPITREILERKTNNIEVLCRAFDSSYNSQPERPETVWNVRGVMNNAWHRVQLKLNVK